MSEVFVYNSIKTYLLFGDLFGEMRKSITALLSDEEPDFTELRRNISMKRDCDPWMYPFRTDGDTAAL